MRHAAVVIAHYVIIIMSWSVILPCVAERTCFGKETLYLS